MVIKQKEGISCHIIIRIRRVPAIIIHLEATAQALIAESPKSTANTVITVRRARVIIIHLEATAPALIAKSPKSAANTTITALRTRSATSAKKSENLLPAHPAHPAPIAAAKNGSIIRPVHPAPIAANPNIAIKERVMVRQVHSVQNLIVATQV